MDGRFSPGVLQGWMDQLYAKTIYLAAFSASPFGGSPLAVEIVGGSYARLRGTFVRTSSVSMTLNADVIFRSLVPGTTIYAVGGFDALTNGNFLFGDLLENPRTFPTGGTYTVEAGELVLGLQIPAP